MSHDTEAFRTRYRAGISPRYSGPLHALWVAGVGLTAIGLAARQLHDVQAMQWLVLLLALLVGNVGEYTIHRRLGHRKWPPARLFYQRHTGDHHSFFTDDHMRWDSTRDWRVVLFPAWLIGVVLAIVAAPGGWLLASAFGTNAGWLWVIGVTATYLLYELLHFSDHLPPDSLPHRLIPGLAFMARLHHLHHARAHMAEINFNLTLPLTDWLMGTLHTRLPEKRPPADPPRV